MGVETNFFLNSIDAFRQASLKLNLLSFKRNFHKGCAIFQKSFINLLQNPTSPRKLLTPFVEMGGGSLSITSNFSLSTSIPLLEIRCPNTIPCFSMKLHFSQFSTKFKSSHLLSTQAKWSKRRSKESPMIDKSSMDISIVSSPMSENIDIIQHWKWQVHYITQMASV